MPSQKSTTSSPSREVAADPHSRPVDIDGFSRFPVQSTIDLTDDAESPTRTDEGNGGGDKDNGEDEEKDEDEDGDEVEYNYDDEDKDEDEDEDEDREKIEEADTDDAAMEDELVEDDNGKEDVHTSEEEVDDDVEVEDDVESEPSIEELEEAEKYARDNEPQVREEGPVDQNMQDDIEQKEAQQEQPSSSKHDVPDSMDKNVNDVNITNPMKDNGDEQQAMKIQIPVVVPEGPQVQPNEEGHSEATLSAQAAAEDNMQPMSVEEDLSRGMEVEESPEIEVNEPPEREVNSSAETDDKASAETGVKGPPEGEIKASPEIEIKATPEAEVKAPQEMEVSESLEFEFRASPQVKAPPEGEIKAPPELEVKATPEAEVKAMPESEVKAPPEVEVKEPPEMEVSESLEFEFRASPEVKAPPEGEIKAPPEAEVKATPEAEVKATLEAEVKATPESEVKAPPEVEVKAPPEMEVSESLEFEFRVSPDVKAPPQGEIKAPPEVEVKATPEAEVKAPPEVEVKATPEAEVKATPEAEVKATPEAEVKAPPEVEVKAMPEAELKATPESEVKAPPESEVKAPPEVDVRESLEIEFCASPELEVKASPAMDVKTSPETESVSLVGSHPEGGGRRAKGDSADDSVDVVVEGRGGRDAVVVTPKTLGDVSELAEEKSDAAQPQLAESPMEDVEGEEDRVDHDTKGDLTLGEAVKSEGQEPAGSATQSVKSDDQSQPHEMDTRPFETGPTTESGPVPGDAMEVVGKERPESGGDVNTNDEVDASSALAAEPPKRADSRGTGVSHPTGKRGNIGHLSPSVETPQNTSPIANASARAGPGNQSIGQMQNFAMTKESASNPTGGLLTNQHAATASDKLTISGDRDVRMTPVPESPPETTSSKEQSANLTSPMFGIQPTGRTGPVKFSSPPSFHRPAPNPSAKQVNPSSSPEQTTGSASDQPKQLSAGGDSKSPFPIAPTKDQDVEPTPQSEAASRKVSFESSKDQKEKSAKIFPALSGMKTRPADISLASTKASGDRQAKVLATPTQPQQQTTARASETHMKPQGIPEKDLSKGALPSEKVVAETSAACAQVSSDQSRVETQTLSRPRRGTPAKEMSASERRHTPATASANSAQSTQKQQSTRTSTNPSVRRRGGYEQTLRRIPAKGTSGGMTYCVENVSVAVKHGAGKPIRRTELCTIELMTIPNGESKMDFSNSRTVPKHVWLSLSSTKNTVKIMKVINKPYVMSITVLGPSKRENGHDSVKYFIHLRQSTFQVFYDACLKFILDFVAEKDRPPVVKFTEPAQHERRTSNIAAASSSASTTRASSSNSLKMDSENQIENQKKLLQQKLAALEKRKAERAAEASSQRATLGKGKSRDPSAERVSTQSQTELFRNRAPSMIPSATPAGAPRAVFRGSRGNNPPAMPTGPSKTMGRGDRGYAKPAPHPGPGHVEKPLSRGRGPPSPLPGPSQTPGSGEVTGHTKMVISTPHQDHGPPGKDSKKVNSRGLEAAGKLLGPGSKPLGPPEKSADDRTGVVAAPAATITTPPQRSVGRSSVGARRDVMPPTSPKKRPAFRTEEGGDQASKRARLDVPLRGAGEDGNGAASNGVSGSMLGQVKGVIASIESRSPLAVADSVGTGVLGSVSRLAAEVSATRERTNLTDEEKKRLESDSRRLKGLLKALKELVRENEKPAVVKEEGSLERCDVESRADFFARLRTFDPRTWWCLPRKYELNAVECARRGWYNSGQWRIRSHEGAEIECRLHKCKTIRDWNDEVERLKRLILDGEGHVLLSEWRRGICSEEFGKTDAGVNVKELAEKWKKGEWLSTLEKSAGWKGSAEELAVHNWEPVEQWDDVVELRCPWCGRSITLMGGMEGAEFHEAESHWSHCLYRDEDGEGVTRNRRALKEGEDTMVDA